MRQATKRFIERVTTTGFVGTVILIYIWLAFTPLISLYKEVKGIRAELKEFRTEVENNLF